ncbi:pathogenesis-related thaumatin-like protein 3.5 [Prosopis cineraria]|uniref:pathogenesis-related thaumatin-like protein 3.5 n=1 Tax=Prosopis cineraria TaxID=364024 RepID=UPI00240F58B8|nr:pathogenesis-related thaumatin-like protein 3.5 [Prosopis cineraria]
MAFAFLLLLVLTFGYVESATYFQLENRCNHTLWPGALSGNSAANLGDGGFSLAPGLSVFLVAPSGWSGRFWARTGCDFDGTGQGKCVTGDCGGLQCRLGGAPPVTLAEFTLGTSRNDKDFYDVSLVDGYNVEVGVRAIRGTGDCQYAGCVTDLNSLCPEKLQVKDGDRVVACKSACAAFSEAEFCCTGDHSTPETCGPTLYSELFKKACPTAYSYAYDDPSSTCTCSGADYVVTFCPSGSS